MWCEGQFKVTITSEGDKTGHIKVYNIALSIKIHLHPPQIYSSGEQKVTETKCVLMLMYPGDMSHTTPDLTITADGPASPHKAPAPQGRIINPARMARVVDGALSPPSSNQTVMQSVNCGSAPPSANSLYKQGLDRC